MIPLRTPRILITVVLEEEGRIINGKFVVVVVLDVRFGDKLVTLEVTFVSVPNISCSILIFWEKLQECSYPIFRYLNTYYVHYNM